MKTPIFPALKLATVLGAIIALLGCKTAYISAGEGAPASVSTSATQPDLVTITNLPLEESSVPPEQLGAEPPELSERLEELVKLAVSGVGDEVLLAYIQNSPEPFALGPDEILYLTDIGFSDVVITALVNHRGIGESLAQAPAEAPATAPTDVAPEQGPTYQPEPYVASGTPPVHYVTPAPLVQYSQFYSALAPYGTWLEVPGYGWSWQPTVAVIHHGWRPYSDRGRWLYSSYGWYWHSDYTWGWAPFHYGRWFHHPVRGWCWKPGSVWGPAWVSWRYTDSYYGWAPLPPGAHYVSGIGLTYYGARVGVGFGFGLHKHRWTFVPARRFHDPHVGRHRVHSIDSLYRNSTVINNIIIGDNNTIINEGIGRDRVSAATRSEIRKVAVRELPEAQRGVGIRPDRLHRDGSELVVYRPRTSFEAMESPTRTASARQAAPAPSHSLGGATATDPGSAHRSIRSRPAAAQEAGAPANPGAVRRQSDSPRPVPVQPSVAQARPEPRSWSALNSGSTIVPSVPQAGTQPEAAARRELSRAATPAAQQPQTPQTFRVPASPSTGETVQRSWPTRPSAAPTPGAVQEPPRSRIISPAAPGGQSPTHSLQAPAGTPAASGIPSWGSASQGRPAQAAPQTASPAVRVFRHEAPRVAAPATVPSSPTPSVRSVSPAPVARPSTPAPGPSHSLTPQRSFAAPSSAPVARPSAPAPGPSHSLSPQRSFAAPQRSQPATSFSRPAAAHPAPQAVQAPSARPGPAASQAPRGTPARSWSGPPGGR
jgi:hypothetical protein